MKIVILDRATLGDDLDIALPNGISAEVYSSTAPEDVAERIKDAEAVFVNKVKLCGENLGGAKKLKIICEAATGFDNINVDWCREHKIAVCNVPGYSVHSVSQVTVSMVLYLANHLREYTRCTRTGEYTQSGIQNRLTPVFHEISGMTWGVAGCGAIGSAVANAARALGCSVLAFKRTPSADFECTDLDTLLEKSDIITVHLPLTCETRRIISEERIAKMKKNAIFVNASRGAVTDENALCRALLNGSIAALGTDVYSAEPFDENSPFWKIKDMDNVCLTPHMAWGAYEARKRCFEQMLENLTAFMRGEIRNRVEL